MPRPNLRKTAAAQAGAEYNPQIAGVRRDTRSQVRSIRSMAPAMEASLDRTGDQLRNAGLSPRDRAIALRELAYRIGDVGASTNLQVQQTREEGRGEIVDLLQGRSQAERAVLSELQNAQAERQQEIADDRRDDVEGFKMDILKEQALKELGLGSYADDDGGGMTPTQKREAKSTHHDAAFYAKQYFQGAKGGITDEKTGEVLIPPDPKSWDDTTWNALVEKVDDQVGDVSAAERAVAAIRDHVQPGADATAGSLLKALGTVASTGAAALAPPALQPVAQFGQLLRPRR